VSFYSDVITSEVLLLDFIQFFKVFISLVFLLGCNRAHMGNMRTTTTTTLKCRIWNSIFSEW